MELWSVINVLHKCPSWSDVTPDQNLLTHILHLLPDQPHVQMLCSPIWQRLNVISWLKKAEHNETPMGPVQGHL